MKLKARWWDETLESFEQKPRETKYWGISQQFSHTFRCSAENLTYAHNVFWGYLIPSSLLDPPLFPTSCPFNPSFVPCISTVWGHHQGPTKPLEKTDCSSLQGETSARVEACEPRPTPHAGCGRLNLSTQEKQQHTTFEHITITSISEPSIKIHEWKANKPQETESSTTVGIHVLP